jgi:hypothetical protein
LTNVGGGSQRCAAAKRASQADFKAARNYLSRNVKTGLEIIVSVK